MTSPSKLLLFVLCVGAAMAFFGEKFTLLTREMAARDQSGPPSKSGLVYAETNMADYGREIHVSMGDDGQYWVTLDVNGAPIRFIVDTGASHISLSYQDAQAAGLDPAWLEYDRVFKTANGETRQAMVTLDRVALESIEFFNIRASVAQRGRMDVSLLGMNFLTKLSGFKVEAGQMILVP